MAFIVKITTSKSILDWLCPHSCMGCGCPGAVLCECCKKDIVLEQMNRCPVCKDVIARGRCPDCRVGLDRFFMCGWRDGLVGDLVEAFKYKSRRAVGGALAELVGAALPEISGRVVVVPLPTIARHVRERGFDHTWLVAKKVATERGWDCSRVLRRAANTVQVGASRKMRRKQAARAYTVALPVEKDVTYVLLDDVWTTGASMRAAAKLLRKAGVERVVGVVLAVSR